MALSAGELRIGVIYTDGSDTYRVVKYEHIKRGRTPATYKVKVKNLATGAITEKSYKDANRFEAPQVERKSAQFLYSDDSKLYFMFSDDYDQFEMSKDELEWESNFLIEGTKVIAFLLEGKVVSLELPKSVELKVVSAPPAVAGNTSSGATKEVELENGLKTFVPLFIEQGDILIINTDRGDYVSRAN